MIIYFHIVIQVFINLISKIHPIVKVNWKAYRISRPQISVLVTPLDTRSLGVKEETQEHWTSVMVERPFFSPTHFHKFLI